MLVGAATAAHAEPLQVTLGAEVGGGSVDLYGTRYGTADAAIDLAAAKWLSPSFGVGVRLGYLVAMPVEDPRMDGHPLDREVPWSFNPEVLARTSGTTWGPVRVGWLASGGAGLASLHTNELCGGGGHLFEEHGGSACVIVKDRSTAITASASGGGYLDAGHFAMFVGARIDADTGGDRTAGLVANLGAVF